MLVLVPGRISNLRNNITGGWIDGIERDELRSHTANGA